MGTSKIIDELIRREGDKFTNDPVDKGGPTKYGITQATLSRYLGRPATVAEVQALSEDTARNIYATMYIEEPGFARIQNEHLRELLVDCGVNHGPSRPIRWLQAAVGARPDGVLGRGTSVLTNTASAKVVFAKVLCERLRFYEDLDDNDPSQERFQDGWTNRCCEFVMILATMP